MVDQLATRKGAQVGRFVRRWWEVHIGSQVGEPRATRHEPVALPHAAPAVGSVRFVARIRVRTVLDAPPRVVWRDLEDIASHQEWMVDAAEIRFLTAQQSGPGTRFECDTKVGPFRLTDVMEITEWRPGRAMGVDHSGVVSGTGRFTLRGVRGNRTVFVWKEKLRFPLWLGGPIGAFLAKPVLHLVWRRNLRNLARRF